jgi:hypothetical protein
MPATEAQPAARSGPVGVGDRRIRRKPSNGGAWLQTDTAHDSLPGAQSRCWCPQLANQEGYSGSFGRNSWDRTCS